jgi:HemY protein
MIRLVFFFLLILALGFGFSWIADRPGDVALQWQGTTYETSLMVVVAGVVALIAAVMFVWAAIRIVLNSPRLMRRFWRNRKRDRGYEALSRGLIAAGAGDPALARRNAKESEKLLGSAPLVQLLDAQTALLEGKREEARARFEKMLEDDDTRLVALRGLYIEAEKQSAGEAARHYAEEAHKEAPALGWAGNAILRYRAMDGDWDAALKALESNRMAGLIDKDAARRQRAVLLTAMAHSLEPAEPQRAAKYSREAHKLAPDLIPAAVIGAKALMRNNDIGRAAGLLESVWKKDPHPEIARAYVDLRLGDSAQDRLKRAKKLAGMRPNHPEGNIIIAEAAIEAQEWETARNAMKPVLSSRPTERACLIMADIEEGEFGDRGRMRDWLSRAVRAPKDAAWTADGHVSEHWLPISPVSGRIDAFEWKVPVEQLGAPSTQVLDAGDLQDLAASKPADPEPRVISGIPGAASAEDATIVPVPLDAKPEADGEEDPAVPPRDVSKKRETDSSASAAAGAMASESGDAGASKDTKASSVAATDAGEAAGKAESSSDMEGAKPAKEADDEAAPMPESATSVPGTEPGKEVPGDKDASMAAANSGATGSKAQHASKVSDDGVSLMAPEGEAEVEDDDVMVKPLLGYRPDDPGVNDDEPDEKPRKRFGLF